MKILITGNSGFLGIKLTKTLSQKNEVYGFDVKEGKDIRNYNQVDQAIKKIDVVIHAAAVADLYIADENVDNTWDINVLGTINVSKACSKYNKKNIYISTVCVYGNQKKFPVTELTLPQPTEIYAWSKYAGEQVVQGQHSRFGTDFMILRIATFYGPEMRTSLVPYVFMKQTLEGKDITIHGNGNQTRTFTYIDDVVDGIVSVVNSNIKNEILNITTEEEISVNNLAKITKDITNSKSKIVHLKDRPGQIYIEKISAQKAYEFLGWQAKINFKEGMDKVYNWFINKEK